MKLSEIPKSISPSFKMLAVPILKLGATPVKKIPVIVSLTSIPSRLRTLHITVRSMMQQQYQLELIVLWLQKDLKNQIRNRLSRSQVSYFKSGILYMVFLIEN
jgi:hypothetical protein